MQKVYDGKLILVFFRFCSRDDHRDNSAAIISRAGAAISEKKISLESEFNSAEFRHEKIKPNSQVFISLGFRSRRIFTGIWTGASLNIPYSDFYGDPSAKTAALFRPRRINGPASIFTRFEARVERHVHGGFLFHREGNSALNTYTERTKTLFWTELYSPVCTPIFRDRTKDIVADIFLSPS